MFDNVGKVLKKITEIIFAVQVIMYFVLGIVFLSVGSRYGEPNFLAFLVIVIVGTGMAYFSCLFLAAIADVIETNRMTAETNKDILNFLKKHILLSLFC